MSFVFVIQSLPEGRTCMAWGWSCKVCNTSQEQAHLLGQDLNQHGLLLLLQHRYLAFGLHDAGHVHLQEKAA